MAISLLKFITSFVLAGLIYSFIGLPQATKKKNHTSSCKGAHYYDYTKYGYACTMSSLNTPIEMARIISFKNPRCAFIF